MTQDTQNQSQTAVFDLEASINQRVAEHLDSLAEKERKEDAERRQQLAARRAECEHSLAKAFPAELREALGMEVDKNSVENPASGYPVNGYPGAVFSLDDQLWYITLEYGNGVYINPPDGNSKQTANSIENVDTLLLSIGLWREREAERARNAREQDAENQRIHAAIDAATPIEFQEPASPRMIGEPDDITVAFILHENISYYDGVAEQMLVKFTSSSVRLSYQDGVHKPRRFTLSMVEFNALIAARDAYRAHITAIEERRTQQRQDDTADTDDVPF